MMKATAPLAGLLACSVLLGGCAQLSVERVTPSTSAVLESPNANALPRPTPAWTFAERYLSFHPLRRAAATPDGGSPATGTADKPMSHDHASMANAEFGSLRDPSPLLEQDLIAVGYASITAQRSSDPAQQRLMAARASRLDAYRNLAEQVYGLTVLAETSVNNDLLRDDRLRAQLMGFISGAELVAMEPLGNDTYQTTLRLSAAQVASLRAQVR